MSQGPECAFPPPKKMRCGDNVSEPADLEASSDVFSDYLETCSEDSDRVEFDVQGWRDQAKDVASGSLLDRFRTARQLRDAGSLASSSSSSEGDIPDGFDLDETDVGPVYFEEQQGELCGQHAINNIVGFSLVDEDILNAAAVASALEYGESIDQHCGPLGDYSMATLGNALRTLHQTENPELSVLNYVRSALG